MRACPRCGLPVVEGLWSCDACGFAPESIDGTPVLAPEAIESASGFDPESFTHLAELENDSFWFAGRSALLLWAARSWFPAARHVLEVGCGTGYVLGTLRTAYPGAHLVGSELYPEGLRVARERVPSAEFVQMDATRIPFREHFDVIGAFDVLEHVDADDQMLREMHQALRPGGGILLTVPQHRWLWSAADDYAHHRRRYSRAELLGKARQAGFVVDGVTSFVTIALPAMLVSRLLQRNSETYDPTAEHRNAERLRRPLGTLLAVERWLIRRGLSLPAGGSLLLAAHRP